MNELPPTTHSFHHYTLRNPNPPVSRNEVRAMPGEMYSGIEFFVPTDISLRSSNEKCVYIRFLEHRELELYTLKDSRTLARHLIKNYEWKFDSKKRVD